MIDDGFEGNVAVGKGGLEGLVCVLEGLEEMGVGLDGDGEGVGEAADGVLKGMVAQGGGEADDEAGLASEAGKELGVDG